MELAIGAGRQRATGVSGDEGHSGSCWKQVGASDHRSERLTLYLNTPSSWSAYIFSTWPGMPLGKTIHPLEGCPDINLRN